MSLIKKLSIATLVLVAFVALAVIGFMAYRMYRAGPAMNTAAASQAISNALSPLTNAFKAPAGEPALNLPLPAVSGSLSLGAAAPAIAGSEALRAAGYAAYPSRPWF
jgi:hypothetical protein